MSAAPFPPRASRIRSLVVLCAALLLALCAGARRAHAQEGEGGEDALRDRIELLRTLPADQRERLRAALRRFRELPPARREELRRTAERVGPERLRELADRDLGRLRARHEALEGERREILAQLGGAARFADLTDAERAYLASQCVRNFQKHVRRSLLNIAGPDAMEAFATLPRAEQCQRVKAAVDNVIEHELAALPEAQRAEILALPPAEQRERRLQLLANYRMGLIGSFATIFDAQVVRPFMTKSPEARAADAARWTERGRWFELLRRLRDLGVSRSALSLLAQLGPEEWGAVHDAFVQNEALPSADRRLALEEAIRAIHGRGATDARPETDARPGRGRPLRRLLREGAPWLRDGGPGRHEHRRR